MERCKSKMQLMNHTHALGSEGECEGMSPYTPKWIPTLRSRWTFKFSKNDLKGQNSLDWIDTYNIWKFLRCRCLKWACMIHLSEYNTSYGWKKGRESKCRFDFWPLKVGNCPKLHAWRWHATYLWKIFNKSYNFSLNLTSIRGLHKSYRPPKWWKS
jgi:hypothetical protein